jgi:hypothetical protein
VTRENPKGRLAVILAGDVVTVHKIRAVIKEGKVQVSNCDPKAGAYLFCHLMKLPRAH